MTQEDGEQIFEMLGKYPRQILIDLTSQVVFGDRSEQRRGHQAIQNLYQEYQHINNNKKEHYGREIVK